jgi:pimeloyl-ACP methyl ester carboxylesterase
LEKLLLLHGALDTKSQFNVLSSLLKKDFEVHTFNFSGHGGEPMPEEEFSIKFFAEEILNYMNKNKISKANISGHSMGGYTGLYLARFFPERVNSVFTINTKLLWNEEISKAEVKMLDAKRIMMKVPGFVRRLEKLHTPNDWKVLLTKVSAMLIDMGNGNRLTDDDFEKIENKIRLAVGDKDKMVSIEETYNVYRKLPDCSMLVLPGTPHPFKSVSTERLAFELKNFFSNS